MGLQFVGALWFAVRQAFPGDADAAARGNLLFITWPAGGARAETRARPVAIVLQQELLEAIEGTGEREFGSALQAVRRLIFACMTGYRDDGQDEAFAIFVEGRAPSDLTVFTRATPARPLACPNVSQTAEPFEAVSAP